MKLNKVSTLPSSLFRNLYKADILPKSKSYVWGHNEINCISLTNDFGGKAFHNLVKSRVKTENLFSTFAVKGVINSEIFRSFTKLVFQDQTDSLKN